MDLVDGDDAEPWRELIQRQRRNQGEPISNSTIFFYLAAGDPPATASSSTVSKSILNTKPRIEQNLKDSKICRQRSRRRIDKVLNLINLYKREWRRREIVIWAFAFLSRFYECSESLLRCPKMLIVLQI